MTDSKEFRALAEQMVLKAIEDQKDLAALQDLLDLLENLDRLGQLADRARQKILTLYYDDSTTDSETQPLPSRSSSPTEP